MPAAPASPAPAARSEITLLLARAQAGDPAAAAGLMPLVYAELRRLAAAKMAREQPGHTLQPTALVHEAWLRLGSDAQPDWQNRAHFFAAAAEAMRQLLVEGARRKLAARHGGGLARVDVDDLALAAPAPDDELLAVHEALDALALADAPAADLVRLRYFAGLSMTEAAAALNLPQRSAERLWAFARAWLRRELAAARAG